MAGVESTSERGGFGAAGRLRLNLPRRPLVTLTLSQVKLQGILGAGKFADVYGVAVESDLMKSLQEAVSKYQHTESMVADDDASTSSDADSACGGSVSSREESLSYSIHRSISTRSRCRPYDQTTQTRYALKCIRPDVFDGGEDDQYSAIYGFLLEVELLTKLPAHPNIIQIFAISEDFFSDPARGFTLLERLDETLEHRLKCWARHENARRRNSERKKLWDVEGKRKEKLHDQRHRMKTCAVGISSAMQHLHRHDLIYRDLKPANIGFAADGTVRLFDFGMARSFQEEKHFTGGVGSARYMAPEVALNKNYGPSADVYSFSMVLWQVCCLKLPFNEVHGMDDWFSTAVTRNKRPNLRSIVSPAVQELVRACWDVKAEARPSFALISHELQRMIAAKHSR